MSASPKYDHDCDGCKFLGHDSHERDWYACGPAAKSGIRFGLRTLIARRSSEPSDYASVGIGECTDITPLELHAARMGFEFNVYELARYGQIYLERKAGYSSFAEAEEWAKKITEEDENLLGHRRKS